MIPDFSLHDAELVQLPVRQDNYIYLLRDHREEVTAVIDPADAEPVMEYLEKRGWALHYILNTHHHGDHTGGNLALKGATDCIIIGFDLDAARIPGIELRMAEDEEVTIGRFRGRVLFLPGHTLGHIAFHFPALKLLFSGDTLFSLGCGRLFEGTPGQMLASLKQIMALPDETIICAAHEYTQDNARFAMTVEPDNLDLQSRMQEVGLLRSKGEPSVPMRLAEEKKANPFLRPDSNAIRVQLGMQGARDVDVFAELRQRKDHF